jgi:hypothetical protein
VALGGESFVSGRGSSPLGGCSSLCWRGSLGACFPFPVASAPAFFEGGVLVIRGGGCSSAFPCSPVRLPLASKCFERGLPPVVLSGSLSSGMRGLLSSLASGLCRCWDRLRCWWGSLPLSSSGRSLSGVMIGALCRGGAGGALFPLFLRTGQNSVF